MKKLVKRHALFFLLVSLLVCPAKILMAQVPEAGPLPAKATDLVPTTNSTEARELFNQALYATDLNENRKARLLYSQAIQKDPNLGIAYLFRATTANTTKEFVEDIKTGKSKTAGASEWEKMYADYLYTNLTGDRDKKISIAKSLAENFPSGRSYVDLGNAYSGNNEYDKAEEAFKKAMEINPGWVGAANALTGMYLFGEKKDPAKGQEYAARVVALAPNSPGAHVSLGDAYRAKNDLPIAAEEYQKAIALDPTAAGPYFKLGHANLFQGKIAEARKNFKAAGERDERKLFAEMMQYYTYGYEGDSKKMMKTFLEAADKRAKQSGGDMNKARSEQLQFLDAAATIAVHNGDVATLKMLIPRITPLSEEMMTIVGTPEAMLFHQSDMLRWKTLLEITEGNYAAAKVTAEQMKAVLEPVKDGRKLDSYHYTVGYLYVKQQQYKEAVDHLKMADQLSLYNQYLLAKAYEGMGDKDNAMKHYKEVGGNNFNSLDNAILRYEVKKKLN